MEEALRIYRVGGAAGTDVMKSVALLLEEQRKMMAVQVQDMAAHSVPPLPHLSGDDINTEEGKVQVDRENNKDDLWLL